MMKNPFDTGIRMTVVRTPGRTRCDVDEFVLCPTNARADAAERALAQIASAMACVPGDDADHVAAVRLLVRERDAARAEVERLRVALSDAVDIAAELAVAVMTLNAKAP